VHRFKHQDVNEEPEILWQNLTDVHSNDLKAQLTYESASGCCLPKASFGGALSTESRFWLCGRCSLFS